MTKQKKPRRKWDDNTKIDLIEDVRAGRKRVTDVFNLGVYSSMWARWKQKYDAGELKRTPEAQASSGETAVVPVQPQSVEVMPAKRKYVKRRHASTPVRSEAEQAIVDKETVFFVNSSIRKIYARIQAGLLSVEELTAGHIVDILKAGNAARGGK